MIQRERPASGEAEPVARPPSGSRAPARAQGSAEAGAGRTPVWEDLYRAFSAEQQQELLSLAERQGVLYSHQLPVTSNGPPLAPSFPNSSLGTRGDQNRQLLARLLGGAVDGLKPLPLEPVEVSDPDLDAVQREAVAKALSTPDIFLLQGLPGSGKSRVVAEIISRAAARGERVLLLAPTTAALDRVLEAVASHETVFAIRCVAGDENAASLPAPIRALTFAERVRALTSQTLECARRQVDTDDRRAQRLRQDEALWPRLDELARQWQSQEERCGALQGQRSRLSIAVEAEAGAAGPAATGFARALWDCTGPHQEAHLRVDKRLGEVRGQIEAREQELATLDSERRALQPLAEAKQRGRWWTGAWWRATFQGTSMAQWAQKQERRQQIQTDLEALRTQSASFAREWEEAERAYASTRSNLVAAEVARRQAELDCQEAALRQEQTIVQHSWQAVCRELDPESPRPIDIAPQAVQTARTSWCRQVERAEGQRAFARQWVAYLEQAPEALASRLPGYVNLVAATTTALPGDDHFGDSAARAAGPLNFDLLVLEEADQITDAEFLNAARRARRWLLVGEAAWQRRSARARSADRGAQTAGEECSARSALGAPRSGAFQRLWHHLHCDPRRLPYAWVQENNRLCCRLQGVTPEQRQWIETERVADFPDIELRILTLPRCRPLLAEIVFPPSLPIDRAKQYVFQELEELAVAASASSLRWVDEADRLVLRLADRDLSHALQIDLQAGIREILGTMAADANGARAPSAAWQTCCVEFDRAAGWDRPRAETWIQQHLGLRDLGRTVHFDVCYRMGSELAAFLSDFLCVGCPEPGIIPCGAAVQEAERNGWSGPVEFVPVPALRESAGVPERGRAGARQRGAATALPRKGGAGLELDLADPRHRERLPPELRPDLPNQGFVNYLEAQAVVRTLTALLKDPDCHAAGARKGDHSAQPAVAVVALYPAQAELIRRLIRQDPVLAAAGSAVEVNVPAAFRQRESSVVLLSLTRSHTHRAVSFGEGPQMLALAMTRARSKLVVFGDPGTLARRSQWEGPLEHLDEDAAACERDLITEMVRYLQGCGSHRQAFHLRQGGGT